MEGELSRQGSHSQHSRGGLATFGATTAEDQAMGPSCLSKSPERAHPLSEFAQLPAVQLQRRRSGFSAVQPRPHKNRRRHHSNPV